MTTAGEIYRQKGLFLLQILIRMEKSKRLDKKKVIERKNYLWQI